VLRRLESSLRRLWKHRCNKRLFWSPSGCPWQTSSGWLTPAWLTRAGSTFRDISPSRGRVGRTGTSPAWS